MSSEMDGVAPVTSEEFRRACGRFATGVTIASVIDPVGAPHGLTVNSFTSVSLEPPLILISLGHQVTTIDHFRWAKYFGINVLTADQRHLSDRFARKGHDRFDGLEWRPGVTGVPILPGVLAAIECAVYRIVPMGDHDLFVGEVVHATVADGNPLIYFASSYRHL
ncbi:MAG: flavin reductase domain protein FMN-binding [Candidatus Solibacter sp.]|jgi:flavin reductase (DIM6/NTAB) family NADH-FMN oxidoreductase RutF|nr:flavin reductase domain protein FMN-binding [Candidatus Solibacter sp.]